MLNNFDIHLSIEKNIRHTKNRLMEIVSRAKFRYFPRERSETNGPRAARIEFSPPNFSRRPIVSRLSTFATNNTYTRFMTGSRLTGRLCRKKKNVFDNSDNPNDEAQTVREIFSVTILGTVFFFSFFFLPRVSLTAGFSSLFCFFHFSFTTFIALTLIFTINTCIVLFLQLQSRARSARCFKFLFVSRLSGVSRGRSLLCGFFCSFFFFCFISFYRVFFVGTRGYVRQRGGDYVKQNAARRVARILSPTDADCNLIEKRKTRGARVCASIDNIPCPLGSFLRDRMKRRFRRPSMRHSRAICFDYFLPFSFQRL